MKTDILYLCPNINCKNFEIFLQIITYRKQVVGKRIIPPPEVKKCALCGKVLAAHPLIWKKYIEGGGEEE